MEYKWNINTQPTKTLRMAIRYRYNYDKKWSKWYILGECNRVMASIQFEEIMKSLDDVKECLEQNDKVINPKKIYYDK